MQITNLLSIEICYHNISSYKLSDCAIKFSYKIKMNRYIIHLSWDILQSMLLAVIFLKSSDFWKPIGSQKVLLGNYQNPKKVVNFEQESGILDKGGSVLTEHAEKGCRKNQHPY